LKKQLTALQTTNLDYIQKNIHELDMVFKRKKVMVMGEGTVFLVLLVIGFYWIYYLEQKDRNNLKEREYFFSGITHELKTPITSLRLHLQTFLKTQNIPDADYSFIQQALADADRMNFLINNLLQSRQIIYGKLVPSSNTIHLPEIFSEVIRKCNEHDKKRIKTEINDVEKLYIKADKEMSVSILNNLIENALRHTDPEHQIQVRIYAEDNHMVFDIANPGHPFSGEFEEEMFRPFKRNNAFVTGHGLGLFVTKSFCEFMNHELEYSYNEGYHRFRWKAPLIGRN
jgi:signal transduction histidine kinase